MVGRARDGQVWGRGALDMKGQVAASAVAIASLAREGFEPAGDLIFVAAADEEVGEDFGLQWLCEAHPEAVRAEYCAQRGRRRPRRAGRRPFYLCSTAEKMSAPFRPDASTAAAATPRCRDRRQRARQGAPP